MIIAFSGYAGSGKDTAARISQWLIFTNVMNGKLSLSEWMGMNVNLVTWQIKKFSTVVIQVGAILLNRPPAFLSKEEFKQEYLKDYQMTGEEFLQRIDALKDHLHPDVWVKALMTHYQPKSMSSKERWMGHAITMGSNSMEYPNWFITDLKSPNQYDALKDTQAVMIRLMRKSPDSAKLHISETALNMHEFDITIYNTGTFEDLANELDRFYKSINLYGRI